MRTRSVPAKLPRKPANSATHAIQSHAQGGSSQAAHKKEPSPWEKRNETQSSERSRPN
jgi:hypothetical protein